MRRVEPRAALWRVLGVVARRGTLLLLSATSAAAAVRAQTIDVGAGVKMSPARFREVQDAISCWARIGDADSGRWVPDLEPESWMGAGVVYEQDGRNYTMGDLGRLPIKPQLWRVHTQCTSPLPIMTAQRACAALRGRNVLILGDSLNEALHTTLVELLSGAPVRHRGPRDCGEGNDVCRGHLLCGGNTTLAFRRSDSLQFARARRDTRAFFDANLHPVVNAGRDAQGRRTYHRNFPVNDLVHGSLLGLSGARPFDVVLINRGAHFAPTPEILHELPFTLRELEYAGAGGRRPIIVWRSTPAGHADCTTSSTAQLPPRRSGAGGRLKWQRGPGCSNRHHWCDFPSQDAAVRRELANRHPGVIFLDVSGPTLLRPDQHSNPRGSRNNRTMDCLYYTGVSVMDHWRAPSSPPSTSFSRQVSSE